MHIRQLCVAILIFCTIYLSSLKSLAQTEYKAAVGVRFGYGIGVSGIYMFNQEAGHGLEFLLRYGYHGLILNKPGIHMQALYEKHWGLGRGYWTIYLGGGPGFGIGKKTSLAKQKYFALGLSPIVGVDYTAQRLRIPLILAFDYKPAFHVDLPISSNEKTGTNFSYYEIAFTVRIGLGR